MGVLAVIAAVLAGIILLIFLLLLPKIKIRLTYNGEFSVGIKYLFIKKELSDVPKTEKADKPAPEKKEKKPLPRYLRGLTFSDWIELVKFFFTGFVFKIKIEKFVLEAKIASDNAADTALLYGRISAAIYSIVSFLSAKNALKDATVNVYTDFLSEKPEYRGEVIFSARPITLIKAGIKAGHYLLTRESLPK